jgi:hypothetical protein
LGNQQSLGYRAQRHLYTDRHRFLDLPRVITKLDEVMGIVSPFPVTVTEEEIRRERRKAREFRSSPWWKKKLARGICEYCGGRFPARELTMDHIVPIIRGGRSTKGNLATVCKPCNTDKQYQLLTEWKGYRKTP